MNLKKLSESLGLSQTTVSRALNGYPEVREATRARVVAAAKAAGYRPNSRARTLATGRAMAVGHVIPTGQGNEMVNPIFGDFIAGAAETYGAAGYDMVLSAVRDGDEAQAYRDLAAAGSVDGLLVHAPRVDDPRIATLTEIGLPFVVHGRTGDSAVDHSWLDIANARAFRRATAFLLDLGHRRVALINGNEALDFARRRRAGYLAAFADRGLSPDPRLMHAADMTETMGHGIAAALLDGPAPPTAFLVSSILTAIGVRRAAGARGMRLGRDLSLITHDDMLSYLGDDPTDPVFTATRSSIRAAGRRCAELILDRIREPHLPPVQELWNVELTLGATTAPCPDGG